MTRGGYLSELEYRDAAQELTESLMKAEAGTYDMCWCANGTKCHSAADYTFKVARATVAERRVLDVNSVVFSVHLWFCGLSRKEAASTLNDRSEQPDCLCFCDPGVPRSGR